MIKIKSMVILFLIGFVSAHHQGSVQVTETTSGNNSVTIVMVFILILLGIFYLIYKNGKRNK